ncbi:S8 family serine peptidase [Caldinitratiruptor microaerophilus]|uniref:Peptidase S8/S53 domain-containing protein n=1 Tax=Caldinitratiruptor microaerophilus TaxID=671077 RepID=A0AA35CKS2_9FIRM|nr:S8 family serine peptidase [Caldinitratiruptor microaerophilus]BDG60233.1 hypothetical protein caldi_13230 [Caldinitratiruptor microaerophilus]
MRKRLRQLAVATLVALGLTVAGPVGAPGHTSAAAPEVLRLRTATVQLWKGFSPSLQEQGRSLYVVKFDGPVRPEWVAALRRLGAEVGDYLPDFAFLVRMDGAQARAVRVLPHVRAVGHFTPQAKVDPGLRTARGPLYVRALSFGPGDRAAGALQALGVRPVAVRGRFVVARLDAAQAMSWARSGDVVYVERVQPYRLWNDQAAGVLRVRSAAWPKGLDGSGQVVGVADTGLDTGNLDDMHPDFAGRVQALYALGRQGDASDTHGHGTHVAGSIVGTGAASDGRVRGMAPGARLVFQSVLDGQGGLGGIPEDLTILFDQAYRAGARIHSDSWGVPVESGGDVYDAQAQAVDRFVWEHRDMAILFAAGNDGDHDRDGKPNYGTVSSPGTAKNAITIGASENNRPDKGKYGDNVDEVALFSSRGPTDDGRVKPDLVAPGTWVLSARSSKAPDQNFWQGYDSRYAFMGGTSMATPLSAGVTALVRQHFEKDLGVTPQASLLKAALINGARPIQGDHRDYGWGRIDLDATLGRPMLFDNESTALSTGDAKTYTYTVKPGQAFRATLVWSDYPASPAAQKALVNDLDLEVRGPDGKVILGNHMLGQDGPDRVNNVENVWIDQPQEGTYTVTVRGYNVPQGPQRYALVVSGDVAAGGENPPPGEPPADRVPPDVRLTAPAAGETLSGTVTLAAEAEDDGTGVERVEFLVDGKPVGTATAAPYRVQWDSTAVADGEHRIAARATDKAGNRAETEPVSVVVRNGGGQEPGPVPGTVAETFTGSLNPWVGPLRVWFEAPAPGPVTLQGKTDGAGMSVVVLGPDGATVGGGTSADLARGVRFEAKAAGTYSAVIQPQAPRGTYVLTVMHPAGKGLAQEVRSGRLGAGGQRTARFDVTAGRTGALNVSLGWTGRAALDLYVLDASGQVVAYSAGSGLNPATVSLLARPSRYTVLAVARSGNADFTVTLTYPK